MSKETQTFEKRKIIEKYFDMIYRLSMSQVKNREHTDDVVQEVFLRYLKTDKVFDSEEHIKAWLIRVAINCCRNVFSNSWHKKVVSLTEEEEGVSFDIVEKTDVYNAVFSLPQKYKAVIHLFYYEDMSIEEISKTLKIKISTVKSQLMRGRKLLKEKLKGDYDFV